VVKDADGNVSGWLLLSTGVPQGSVLGPLLFSIFLLDLPDVLQHSRHMLYADDLHIYASGSPSVAGLAALTEGLSRDATAVVRYAQENGLKINGEKTSALLLGSLAYLSQPEMVTAPLILVDDTPVPYSQQLKSLGVIITFSLSWEEHINRISARDFSSLHSLRFYKHALTWSFKKRLVESLIFPRIDYCCLLLKLIPVHTHPKATF